MNTNAFSQCHRVKCFFNAGNMQGQMQRPAYPLQAHMGSQTLDPHEASTFIDRQIHLHQECPVHLTCMSLECRKKTCTDRTHEHMTIPHRKAPECSETFIFVLTSVHNPHNLSRGLWWLQTLSFQGFMALLNC